jgi:DNA-binding protein H-NS
VESLNLIFIQKESEAMELKIRNVDPFVVKTFDEMAKKQSISRQELLNSILTKVAYEHGMNESEALLKMLVQKNISAMEKMADKVEQLENLLSDLMEE